MQNLKQTSRPDQTINPGEMIEGLTDLKDLETISGGITLPPTLGSGGTTTK